MMKRANGVKYAAFLLMFLLLFAAVPAQKAEAAVGKPKFKLATYSDGTLILKWSKVPGAKKYQILRSTKKNGKYKVYAYTKSTTYKKAAKGYYYYRIRAVKNGKVGKMSAARHIFSATARVVGYGRGIGQDLFKIRVTNKTNSRMYFRGPGIGCYDGNVYILNSYTGNVIWRKVAYVTNQYGSGKIAYAYVPGNSTRYVYMAINTNVPSYYLYNPFMTSLSFFPKKLNSKIHFAFGVNGKESAVAATTR